MCASSAHERMTLKTDTYVLKDNGNWCCGTVVRAMSVQYTNGVFEADRKKVPVLIFFNKLFKYFPIYLMKQAIMVFHISQKCTTVFQILREVYKFFKNKCKESANCLYNHWLLFSKKSIVIVYGHNLIETLP